MIPPKNAQARVTSGGTAMPLLFVREDITRMHVDVIVNAANPDLRAGGGVCGAIFEAAGPKDLAMACQPLAPCATGQAVLTPGFSLPARHIIHAVGPIWQGGTEGEEELLRACYRNSLDLAVQHNLHTIAFPLISSGLYGYPKEAAMQIAVDTIREFLNGQERLVYLVFFDAETNLIGEKRFQDVTRYIDDHYAQTQECRRSRMDRYPRSLFRNAFAVSEAIESPESAQDMAGEGLASSMPAPAPAHRDKKEAKAKRSLEDVVAQLEESFSVSLLRLIDEKGLSDVEVYKRANIDRRLFSKIRSHKAHNPRKTTALAFSIALGLSLDEARDLLAKAGYALSNSSRFDLIVSYCIEEGMQDVHAVNEVLFQFQEPLLGA
jgi:O-acetyl-ADP-ribose deacetylase